MARDSESLRLLLPGPAVVDGPSAETNDVTFSVQKSWGSCAVDSDVHVVGTCCSFGNPRELC
jgi:hypothetical protein